jgi:hypothetical protein
MGDIAELKFSCFGNDAVTVTHCKGESQRFDLPNPMHVQQPMIQAIVDEVRGENGTKSPSVGASGLRTQIVMDQVLERYYGGREDGFWQRPWPKNAEGKPEQE